MCGDTVSVTVTVQREIDEDDSGEEKAEGSIGKVTVTETVSPHTAYTS